MAVLVVGVACSSERVLAAEFEIHPALGVSEEYNDNILETASDRKTDFVTRVNPGASLLYRSSGVSADLSYAFEYRNYARKSRDDEQIHTVGLVGTATLVDNFLFLELSDTLSRISLDITRDVTKESLFVNQTEQNRASVSPYAAWHFGDKTLLKTGYRYTDTRYWGATGTAAGIDRREHRGYADLQHQATEKLGLTASYSYADINTDLVRYGEHDVSGGMRYEYADKCFLFGGVGNSWQDFDGGGNASNFFWNAGVTHDFGFLTGTAEARVQYADDPVSVSTKETRYSLTLDKRLEKGSLSLIGAYSEYRSTRSEVGEGDRDLVGVTANAAYDLSPRLTVGVSLVGDKVSHDDIVDEYPYHFSGSGSATYRFNYDISTTLTLNHVEYRHTIDSATGARQTNRVILEVRKVF